MKRWYSYLIIVLLVLGVLEYYFLPKVTGPLHFDMIWNTKNKQSGALVRKGEEVPEEVLALRERHHLRPLMEMENGTRVRDVANGIYGFAPCDVQTVNATRTNSSSLEIHKHLDGIVYYVGYASADHIEKYLTRQKNFHILVSLAPRKKASLLLEIPVDFVSKCTSSSAGDGSLIDLFVMAIPELQSFERASDLREPRV
jgi:hypothetical protein